MRSIFGKNKTAAIAATIIDTSAAVVKTLAQLGWWGIPMAAAMAAKGYAEVQNIRNTDMAGFAMGTPGTSFVDFGRETVTALHGNEAVVNAAQGATLGEVLSDMVGDALRSGEDRTVRQLERMEEAADRRERLLPYLMRSAVALGNA